MEITKLLIQCLKIAVEETFEESLADFFITFFFDVACITIINNKTCILETKTIMLFEDRPENERELRR